MRSLTILTLAMLTGSSGDSSNITGADYSRLAEATDRGHFTGVGWQDEVAARLEDGAHAFVADEDGFVASSPTHGITGSFDAGGARLERMDDALTVRAAAWGRGDALDTISMSSPLLGACIPGREDPEGACIQRLEYSEAGLTEWWASRADGFEQGWTVSAPPAGEGRLAIHVAVEGADAVVGDGEVWLEGNGGEAWYVSGLVAWDADGAPLDARFEPAPGGLRVTVDDDGARYPIEIDPVYTTATTVLSGEPDTENFGFHVAGAGDVDGDGYADVLVSTDEWPSSRAFVYHGSASGVATIANRGLGGGWSLSSAGDVNGDGYDDVVTLGYGGGSVSVYFGSAIGLVYGASLEKGGVVNGESVSGAGDVNGDGYDDVIVAAYGYIWEVARAYVYLGAASGMSPTGRVTLEAKVGHEVDYFVSGAGDVNGDGYDDVIVGEWGSFSYTGYAYVHHGSASGVSTTATTILTGDSTPDDFGFSVSRAGDVNGDGYDDVIVGAPGHHSKSGRASVYHGSASGVATTPSWNVTGSRYDDLGYSVSGAGDLNGDGYDDVIVGAPGTNARVGAAYVFHGSVSGVANIAPSILSGSVGYDVFGTSVSGAGDVDGDGFDDVIVGSPGYDPAGAAYVYHGYAADMDDDGYTPPADCNDTSAAVNPGADEICNGIDDDCDGAIDRDATNATTWYADADADGYTDAGVTVSACDRPHGYAAASDPADCDDGDPAVFPGEDEVPGDSIDQDCDGSDLGGSGTGGGCGCAASGSEGTGVLLGLLAILAVRRRVA